MKFRDSEKGSSSWVGMEFGYTHINIELIARDSSSDNKNAIITWNERSSLASITSTTGGVLLRNYNNYKLDSLRRSCFVHL